MALAGLSEELAYKLRTAQPKAKQKAKKIDAYSQVQLDSEVTDQQLIARLASLAPLIHASTVACKSLQQLGEGFQRSTRSIGADAVFLRQLEDKDPPMAAASKGMIDAFGDFGDLFLELSKQLRKDILSPMEAIQNNLKEACMDERIQIKELEQQETLCSQAVQEISRRKEKANAELQAAAKAEGRKGWFRSTGSSARVEEIAAMQTAIVEELASKIDQEAAVRRRKEQCLQGFKTALQQLDKTCVSHLEKLSEDLSSMWIKVGQRVESIGGTWKGPSPANRVLRPYLPPHRAGAAVADQASRQTSPSTGRGIATDMTTNRIELQEVSSHASPKASSATRESSESDLQADAEETERSESKEHFHIYVAPAESLAPISVTSPTAEADRADRADRLDRVDRVDRPELKLKEPKEPKEPKASMSTPQTLQFGEHVRKLGFEVRSQNSLGSLGGIAPKDFPAHVAVAEIVTSVGKTLETM